MMVYSLSSWSLKLSTPPVPVWTIRRINLGRDGRKAIDGILAKILLIPRSIQQGLDLGFVGQEIVMDHKVGSRGVAKTGKKKAEWNERNLHDSLAEHENETVEQRVVSLFPPFMLHVAA